MKGAPMSWARRRAISVLPTPVGPIMMMFLGVTSLRNSGGSCCRRQRLRMAIATARLAAFWPMMYLSSSATTWRGVRSGTGASNDHGLPFTFSAPMARQTTAALNVNGKPRLFHYFHLDVQSLGHAQIVGD